MNDIYTWPNDLYPLVKTRFDMRYAKRLDVISEVCDVIEQDEIDYRLEGVGGYGELPLYNGSNLMTADQKIYYNNHSQGARNRGEPFLQEGEG